MEKKGSYEKQPAVFTLTVNQQEREKKKKRARGPDQPSGYFLSRPRKTQGRCSSVFQLQRPAGERGKKETRAVAIFAQALQVAGHVGACRAPKIIRKLHCCGDFRTRSAGGATLRAELCEVSFPLLARPWTLIMKEELRVSLDPRQPKFGFCTLQPSHHCNAQLSTQGR